jgi:uncharacterized spore protein YtfJ
MKKKIGSLVAAGVFLSALALAQAPPQQKAAASPKAPLPMYQLAEEMAKRLGSSLQVKTVVGEPMKVGKITIIPIMMIDTGFGGGGGGAPQNPDLGGKGFYMSGEARPLGFVVVTKSGTQFVSVGKVPRK